jgi:hypothetical protein
LASSLSLIGRLRGLGKEPRPPQLRYIALVVSWDGHLQGECIKTSLDRPGQDGHARFCLLRWILVGKRSPSLSSPSTCHRHVSGWSAKWRLQLINYVTPPLMHAVSIGHGHSVASCLSQSTRHEAIAPNPMSASIYLVLSTHPRPAYAIRWEPNVQMGVLYPGCWIIVASFFSVLVRCLLSHAISHELLCG